MNVDLIYPVMETGKIAFIFNKAIKIFLAVPLTETGSCTPKYFLDDTYRDLNFRSETVSAQLEKSLAQ